ncbi:unnamed protein product [Urochloa decumbens]|uniref:NAC domain-containing protein n=1 Tax=Urochloa decumbens TaxID=240449 RepID=A0ABC8ZZB3_9POAL
MAAAAEEILNGIPPTFRFRPTPRELVEFYLLPRARGQDPFPGVIIEDDAAGSSLPRDLFARHGLGSEEEAYFLVRAAGDAKKPAAARRQNRSCGGGAAGACWKMQSSVEKGLLVGGEKILCRRGNLNLHMGKGKDGGSVGWVMHEYTIVSPPCPSQVKICHIAFSGHGRKRKREPDEQEEECQSEHAPQSQRARVDAIAAAGCSSSGGMLNHDSCKVEYASADDEERLQLVLTQDMFPQRPLVGSSEFMGFPSAASANAEPYQELEQQVPSTEQQQQGTMPQSMAQQSTMAEPEQLCAAELDFWSSIGVDVQSSNFAEQELWSLNGVDSNAVVPHISNFLGFQSAASTNACQELEQQVLGTEEEQVMMLQLMSQRSTMAETEQLSAGELEFWSSKGVDVQSSNCAEQELWSSNGVDSNGMVPHISDFLGSPSAASANAEQCQELEQQVPSAEEQQVMMPHLMGQQSSVPEQLCAGELEVMMPQLMGQQSSMPEQLCPGELEFWSSTGVNVQSNNFAEQEFWRSTGFQSNSMVPHIGDMAGDYQDHQDFWSLSKADVQSNCAVPDMTAGALVGAHWGGYSITC